MHWANMEFSTGFGQGIRLSIRHQYQSAILPKNCDYLGIQDSDKYEEILEVGPILKDKQSFNLV